MADGADGVVLSGSGVEQGSTVVFRAIPDAGWFVREWGGGCSGGTTGTDGDSGVKVCEGVAGEGGIFVEVVFADSDECVFANGCAAAGRVCRDATTAGLPAVCGGCLDSYSAVGEVCRAKVACGDFEVHGDATETWCRCADDAIYAGEGRCSAPCADSGRVRVSGTECGGCLETHSLVGDVCARKVACGKFGVHSDASETGCVCRRYYVGDGFLCSAEAPVGRSYSAEDFRVKGWATESVFDDAGRRVDFVEIPLVRGDSIYSSRRSSVGTGDSDAPASVGMFAAEGDAVQPAAGAAESGVPPLERRDEYLGAKQPAAGAAESGVPPLERRDEYLGAKSPGGGSEGRQVSGRLEGCVFAAHPEFDYGDVALSPATYPRCGSAEVFNGDAIPRRPDGFDPGTDFITAGFCPDGFVLSDNREGCLAQGAVAVASSSGDYFEAGPYLIGGALLAAGIAVFDFYGDDGEADGAAFSVLPQASFSYEDGDAALGYGVRVDYARGDWGLWWEADEERRGWGGSWRGEVFRASGAVTETREDFRVAWDLGGEWDFWGWRVSPGWRGAATADVFGDWGYDAGAGVRADWERAGWGVGAEVSSEGGVILGVEREFGAGVW